jgi:hypothetical protein
MEAESTVMVIRAWGEEKEDSISVGQRYKISVR